jgi:hypothetical protein
MTTVAAIGYTGVIKHARSKTSGDMTHGTVFGRRYMICRFPSGRSSIVTGGAIVHDTGVIKCHGQKRPGYVTDTAILGGGQVIGVFAAGGNVIVARGTATHDTGVIKHPGSKSRRAVAAGTVFRSRHMNRRFADG